MDIENKKAALLKAMLAKSNLTTGPSQEIAVLDRNAQQAFPLTYAQEQLWIIDQMLPPSSTYTIPQAFRLEGPIDQELLTSSFVSVTKRHETLRTRFVPTKNGPVAMLRQHSQFRIGIVDISGADDEQMYSEIERLIQLPFNLESDELLRAWLLKLGDDEHVLLVAIHHIISDGWSLSILFRELSDSYNAGLHTGQLVKGDIPDLNVQAIDYAAWQRQNQESGNARSSLKYWQNTLSGQLPISQLPIDKQRPPQLTTNGDFLQRSISEELSQKLLQVAKTKEVTPFVLFFAAYTVLLQKYTGEEDILIGTPVSSRNTKELEALIGFFINTLALRSHVSGEARFSDYLNTTKQNILEAFDHQETPLPVLIKTMKIDRDLSHNPVFQVMFAFQNAPQMTLKLDRVEIVPLPGKNVHTSSSKVDLSLIVEESIGNFEISAEYNTDLFEKESIDGILQHFEQLLESIVANPNADIRDLQCMDKAESEFLLHELNETSVELPKNRCVLDLFDEAVKKNPEGIAIVSDDREISYGELDELSHEQARYLVKRGVLPGHLVAVFMQRSPEMIVALLAILRAGGAYIPIDPKTPEGRLAFMLNDSEAVLLLTDSDVAVHSSEISTPCINLLSEELGAVATDIKLPREITQNSPAYLIYTSGSTGKPKGVVIHHRALLNLVHWHQKSYEITANDRATSLAGLGFDASVWELWPYICCGSSVYLSDDEIRLSPKGILRWYSRNKITISFLPTPLAEAVLQETMPDNLRIRYLLTGGDKLRVRPSETIPFKLINHYGPTENAVVTTCCEVLPGAGNEVAPPIGRPIDNTKVYVLDDYLNPVPRGARGQLYISGVGLTQGYMNREELNEQKLISNPHGQGEFAKLYATGDMVRFTPENSIEFLERTDFQVKIRGMRIELGEIESIIMSHSDVTQAIVAAVTKGENRSNDFLVGFYQLSKESSPDVDSLRRHLSSFLPDYMVPAQLVKVESFTLTANGKIDRATLPYPEAVDDDSVVEKRFTDSETQRFLLNVWSVHLELKEHQLGLADNFFHIGGHSLLATKVVADINDHFGTDLPVATLFEHSTIESLALFLAAHAASSHVSRPELKRATENIATPATHTQRRLWYLEQLDPGDPVYNIPVCVELDGQLSTAAVKNALQKVCEGHDALRTTFAIEDEELVQIIHNKTALPLSTIDLVGKTEKDVQDSIIRLSAKSFDLKTGPLIHFSLLNTGNDKHVLVFVVHHIVFDGWSVRVFLNDFYKAYDGICRDPSFSLAAPELQFSDFAIWQHNWIQHNGVESQLAVWLKRFEGGIPTLNMPTQFPRPTGRSTAGAEISMSFDEDLMHRIESECRRVGVTVYIYLLSVYFALLFRYTQQNNLVVGTTIANRLKQETESMLGCFVNTLALRVDVDATGNFEDLFRQVRTICLEAFDNQDIPFAKLVEELRPTRDTSRTPIFQTLFSQYECTENHQLTGGLEASIRPISSQVARTDLSVAIETSDGNCNVRLEYGTALFTREFASEFLENYRTLLESCIDDPRQTVATAKVVNDRARDLMLGDWNKSASPYDASVSMLEMFQNVVSSHPDKIAIIAGDQDFTYREIDNKATNIAAHLRAIGAQPGDMVAICLDRSELLIVAILAVFKIGASYLPLDPEYPANRIQYIIEDAKASHVLLEESFTELFALTTVTLVNVQYALTAPAASDPLDIRSESLSSPDSIAYVIYTSGSTGKPKGVMVSQGNLTNFIHIVATHPGISIEDRVLAITTLSFDIAVTELIAPIAYGATAVIADRNDVLNPQALSELLDKHDITYAQGTPSAWQAILASGWQGKQNLKLGVIGEALSVDLSKRLQESTHEFWNLYGPTETTIHSSGYLIQGPNDEPLIGKPVANTQLFIFDPYMQLVPVGAAGELYIGGDGVSLGYLGKKELTSERFVANPLAADSKSVIYRTGDKVRFKEDGNIEFLGRFDNQVKIRGFRIELGEIESVVDAHAQIDRCVATVREDRPGDVRLVIYYIPSNGQDIGTTELRKYIRNQLPNYMVPQHYVPLEQFPMTPNAKINRQALPAPTSTSSEKDRFVAPRTKNEKRLAAVWREVLNTDRVGAHDNFFDLGGHSLLSFQVIAKVRDKIGVEIQLRPMIMDNLEQIAALFDQEEERDMDPEPAENQNDTERSASKRLAGFFRDSLSGNGKRKQ